MNSLGVVNPIGLPAPVARVLRAVPRAAWIFFGAAAVFLVAEFATAPGSDLAAAVWQTLVLGASTGLLIALPGIALVRTPDIRSVAPLAYVGLVLIAVGTILRALAGGVVGQVVGVTLDAAATGDVVQTVLVASGWGVVAVGWLALMRSLAARSASAGIGLTALAVVAVAAIGMTIVSALATTLQSVAGGAFDATFGALVVVGFAAHAATAFSWAVLAWTFIRSMSSDRSGSAVAAGLWAVTVALGALALAPDRVVSVAWLEANQDLWNSIGTVVWTLPPMFLAGAVALGLLDRDAARRSSAP